MVAQNAQQNPWTGRGRLENLVAELNRQKESRLDFIMDGRMLNIDVTDDGNQLKIVPWTRTAKEFLSEEGMPISGRALKQMGEHIKPGIPGKFLENLTQQSPVIASNLIGDLLHQNQDRHFVRCLDGRVRAWLSNKYRVLDNYDLAFTALDVVRQVGGEVIESTLSDTHMRLKFTTKEVWDSVVGVEKGGPGSHSWLTATGAGERFNGQELPGGPGTVHPVVTVSNSETGHGGLHVQVGILQAICVNSSIIEDVAAQVHLGSRLEVGLYSEETMAADSKAVMLKCRDAIRAAFDKRKFKLFVQKAQEAAGHKISAPQTAVANVVNELSLSDEAKNVILGYFVKDYDLTRYGLAQAVSRYSQDVKGANEASVIEQAAGRLIREEKFVAV